MSRTRAIPSPAALLALSLAALSLAGCGRPAVAPKPPAFQASQISVRDWDTVAMDIASTMQTRGLLGDAAQPFPGARPGQRPAYYIHLMVPGSPFLNQVKQSLTRDILDRHGVVSLKAAGSIVINLDVGTVRFSGDNRRPDGSFTLAGLAGSAGILIGDGAPYTAGSAALLSAGGGVLADILVSLAPHTNTEAVWRASIISNDAIVMLLQAPVYIGDRDTPLYAGTAHTRPIASLAQAPASAPRRLRYTP